MLDRLESMARSGAKDAARELLQQLEQMMENLQMATPDMNGDDLGDMMQQLDELGEPVRAVPRLFRLGGDRPCRVRAANCTDGHAARSRAHSALQDHQAAGCGDAGYISSGTACPQRSAGLILSITSHAVGMEAR